MKIPFSKWTAFIAILLSVVLMPSCVTTADKFDAYTINGRIDGLEAGKVILARLDLITNERVDVDSTEIKRGKFTFKGNTKSPYLHTLFFPNTEKKIHFFLENSRIKVSGNFAEIENASITGSREDSLFRSYNYDDIFDRIKGMEIMLSYPDYCFSAFTAYYQFQIHNIHADTLDMVMKRYPDKIQESEYYTHLSNLYRRLKLVAISQPAPAFSLPDTAGNLVKLEDFRGTYVLIDFWASWCPPCRAENPDLVEVYRQFSDKNFTILGVSVDKNGGHWKNAINSDNLPWINVSSLTGWDKVSEIYGVESIPQNFLLDPDGIIIEKNIEPHQLIDKLGSILADKMINMNI